MHDVLSLALLLCHPLSIRAGTNAFGKGFLAETAQQEDVVTLPSGLQYRVLELGDGEDHPLPSTDCTCHYEGRTAQEYSKTPKGVVFDSSYLRGDPADFSPAGVIAGWTEAMQLMVEGDKWELFIPSELAYGDSGQGADIGAGDVLVFSLQLLKINGASTPAEPRGLPPYTIVESANELDAWLGQTAVDGKAAVLALMRQPLTKASKLFSGFKKAARADSAGRAYALSAVSRYDAATKKFTTSAVESALGFSAPSILVIGKGVSAAVEIKANPKATAQTCKTGYSRSSVSVEDVAAAMAACEAPGGKDEL